MNRKSSLVALVAFLAVVLAGGPISAFHGFGGGGGFRGGGGGFRGGGGYGGGFRGGYGGRGATAACDPAGWNRSAGRPRSARAARTGATARA